MKPSPDEHRDRAPAARRPLILAAIMMATFMAAVESTIVATAMPSVTAELGGFQLFSWVFSIYLLTQAVTVPIYGRLADLYGRKRVFFVGASLFLAGSALCGLAPNMLALIAFRALQGLGAGAILPIAATIAGDIYTPTERARVQGYISGVWGFSAIIGPALGAFLVQHVHWAVVFWVNLPIGVAAMGMLAVFLHERKSTQMHQIDWIGSMLLMAGTGALMLGLVQANDLSAPVVAGLLGAAGVILAGFVVQQQRTAEPMMPFHLWRTRIIAVSNSGAFTAGAVIMGITAFLPTYVQAVMGRDAATAGAVLAVMSVGWSLASALGGQIMIRTSYRLTAITGSIAMVAGTVVLILLEPGRGPLFAGAGALLTGTGMGFLNVTFVVSIQSSVGWSERGAATSSNLFMRMVGQALGAALFGAILNLSIQRTVPEDHNVVGQLMEPALRQGLGATEVERLSGAVAIALHHAYLLSGLIALITLALMLCMPAHARPGTAPGGR